VENRIYPEWFPVRWQRMRTRRGELWLMLRYIDAAFCRPLVS
jgi:hypothetical protein